MIDRFGVTIDWRGATLQALTTIALQADHLGCGYLWIPEAWGLEAFSTIGHLITVTKRIKIGTGIANIFSRSAANLAMASATLNQLAPGRFLLGLGVSGKGLVESFHGVKFDQPLKRTHEYVDTIRMIEVGGVVNYQGGILNLSRFRLFTSPVKSPTPIYLGAIGEKNLNLAGRIADGAIVTFYPISKLKTCADIVNDASGSTDNKKKIFCYIPLHVVHNEREERTAKGDVSRLVSFYVKSMGKYYPQNLEKLGYASLVTLLKSNQAEGADKSSILDETYLRDFSLIGSASEIIDRVAQLPDTIFPVFGLNASSALQGDSSARMLREMSVELANRKPRRI